MSITRRESFVVHFYYEDGGRIVARITDVITSQSWIISPALDLRACIAGSAQQRTSIDERKEVQPS